MPTTGAPGNIWYPDATSPVAPLENLFLQQATSVNDALSALTPGSAWTNYTPIFSSLTLGNGTLIAKHRKNGASRDLVFQLMLGSTSTIGSAPGFSPPTAIPYDTSYGARFLNSGAAFVQGGAWVRTTIVYPLTSGGTQITATTPFTWGAGDQILMAFTYPED